MVWSYDQDFNSLSTAGLSGQDSWGQMGSHAGHGNFNVQSSTVYEGAKAVSIAATAESYIKRAVTAVTSGVARIALRTANNSGPTTEFWLGEESSSNQSPKCRVSINANSNKGNGVVIGATTTSLGSCANNTWHIFDLEFDASTDQCRGRLNEGDWSTWRNLEGNATITQVDWIGLGKQNGSSDICLYDTIVNGAAAAPSRRRAGFMAFF